MEPDSINGFPLTANKRDVPVDIWIFCLLGFCEFEGLSGVKLFDLISVLQ